MDQLGESCMMRIGRLMSGFPWAADFLTMSSPVWGGVIRAEKITDPITIPTEWFCIAFCGINWLVPKDTHRNPLTTVVDCDSFGSSWILLGQAENIWLVSLFFNVFYVFPSLEFFGLWFSIK